MIQEGNELGFFDPDDDRPTMNELMAYMELLNRVTDELSIVGLSEAATLTAAASESICQCILQRTSNLPS